MKRFVSCFVAAAVCASAGLFAQDAGNDDYVLEQARREYQASGSSSSQTAPAASASNADNAAPQPFITITVNRPERPERRASGDEKRYPYTPFVLSVVPGISAPMGVWDTSMALGWIGSVTGSVDGFAAAGAFNIGLGTVNGFQGAGAFNIAEGDVNGFQGAGVFNIAKDVNGFQGAGVFNIAEDVAFAQGAGVFNIAQRVSGVQAAGVFNVADELDGVQAAGVINVAGKAKGLMIAPINVADSLDGVAIGFLNFIADGINDLAVDYQFATDTAYLTYRTGTRALYAVAYAGLPGQRIADGFQSIDGLSAGFGLGRRVRFLFLSADIEAAAELPVDPASWSAAAAADDPRLLGLDRAFGSLRVSFGFGGRKNLGLYMGVKTDIAPAGAGLVPEHLRAAWGEPSAEAITLFGERFELWPKFFMGFRF